MARKSRKNIGLIGLGIVGSRVAAALRAAGFNVFVWNRTPRPHPNFLGSPAEVAGACDIIQVFVADGRALLDVIGEFEGKLTPNHILINSSTIGPDATLEAAKLVESLGAKFLDAPFTGSKMAAEKAQLVYYIGGSDETLGEVEPVLKASSKAIVKIGGIGQAASVKVATNMLVAATVQALAEAVALVKKSGLPGESLAAALENHGARSGVTDMKLPGMLTADFEPHFSVKHMLKDMQLAIGMAQSHSVELPVTTAAARVLYDAANRGWTDLDFSSVLKFYDEEPEPVAAPAEPSPPAEPAAVAAGTGPEPAKSGEPIPPADTNANAETTAAETVQAVRPPGLLQRWFGKK